MNKRRLHATGGASATPANLAPMAVSRNRGARFLHRFAGSFIPTESESPRRFQSDPIVEHSFGFSQRENARPLVENFSPRVLIDANLNSLPQYEAVADHQDCAGAGVRGSIVKSSYSARSSRR